MAIIKWEPFKDLISFRERMNKRLDKELVRSEEKVLSSETWVPSVDIRETDKEIFIEAELPGLDEKDVELEIEDHNLVLMGKREFENETKKEDYHRIERSYGPFIGLSLFPDPST